MGIDQDIADALLLRYTEGMAELSGTLVPGTWVGQGTYHDVLAALDTHSGSIMDIHRPSVEDTLSSSLNAMRDDLWDCMMVVLDELEITGSS